MLEMETGFLKSQELKDQMMSENLKVAVLGLGNVGQNFIRILSDSAVHIRESCGSDIEIAFVADSTGIVKVDPGRTYANILLAKRAQNIQSLGEPATIEQVLDSGIDAIIDVSSASKDGNRELEIFRAAIDRGINIVTANKSPLALHWTDIVPYARDRNVRVLFEATVAGGVPLFNFAKYSCGPSRIIKFRGIVSLTANFVLKMMHSGTSFEEAVKKAQEMGVAETDYTDDTSGLDGARKTVILANALFDRGYSLKDIKYSGIPEVDLSALASEGDRLRLFTSITSEEETLEISTGFGLLDQGDFLLSLGESALGYEIETDNNGVLRLSSAHDGPRETAAAVVNDVMILARERKVH